MIWWDLLHGLVLGGTTSAVRTPSTYDWLIQSCGINGKGHGTKMWQITLEFQHSEVRERQLNTIPDFITLNSLSIETWWCIYICDSELSCHLFWKRYVKCSALIHLQPRNSGLGIIGPGRSLKFVWWLFVAQFSFVCMFPCFCSIILKFCTNTAVLLLGAVQNFETNGQLSQ